MNKEDAKVINIGDSSPINISLVDNTPIPVVVDVIKNEPQPIEVYSNTSIISGAANLYELGDVASDGHQVLDSGDKKVLMLNADDKHPGKWMAGKVNLSEYAKKTELDEISNNIENTNKDLSGVKEDLLEKEAFLDEKIAEIKGNLEKTKDELIVTQKELVDAKNELSDARQRLEEQGVTVEMVVGQVNEQEQKITTAITNIESESDRVNILRSEMDGINLTITNEILSQLNEDGSDITLKIGQKIDARAETIETAVKKLREGTDETMVSWIGQKIDGRAETIETAIKKLQTGEDVELVSWVGQKIDGRAETIETAVAKLREGTDETMVSWVGQKIDAKAETITTAVIESLEQEGFATKEFVGQEIDGAKKSVTTGIMTFITEQDFSTKSFVGQEIDGAEGRITTAYEKYVEDKGYATTTFVGQEIDGVNKTITTAVAESKESIVGEDGVINSRIQAAYTSWDIAGIKNSVVDQNGNYIKSSEINQKADNILIKVQENDEGYKGRFSSIEANLDSVSTTVTNGDNYAAIIARVNEDSSSVTIEANKINLLGETVARELSAIKATINELTLTNAHVSGVVECVMNDTVYWQLLNDGSGTLAKGNIKWNPDGSGSLASGNINWDINGNAVFNGSIESGSGKIAGWTISADCISSNREGANTKLFSNGHLVNEETDENGKLWKHWEFNYDGSGSIANNSLSWDPYGYIKLGDDVILGANELRVAQLISNVSLLLSMFELDENGDIKTKDYYADGAWHSRGLYSPSFISAGGVGSSSGGGGIDSAAMWALLGDATGEQINKTHISAALEGYQTLIPDLASIRGNAANGNTAYGWGDHSGLYLPLSGGTMSNTNVITNLNADLLDGIHKSSLFVSNFSQIQSSELDAYATRQSGTYIVQYSDYTKSLVTFRSLGSASALELLYEYENSNLLCRTAVDSNRFTAWKQIAFTDSNVASASKWATARTITLTGSVTGSVSIDGSQNVSLATTTNHTHTFDSLTSKPTTISGYGITDALTTSNYNSYAPTLTGGGASGTWGINISGNAETATNADLLDGYHHDSFAKIASSNNLLHEGNEFTFVPSGHTGRVWINYRTTGGTNGNIVEYSFGNGAGGALAVISNGQFSGNAASATQLQTSRTIWGQSFNGTGDVSGALSGVTTISASGTIISSDADFLRSTFGSYGTIFESYNNKTFVLLTNKNNQMKGNNSLRPLIIEQSNGNVYLAATTEKVGIGTEAPSEKLHVIGNILASGAITAGTASDSRLKSNIATLVNASSVLRQLRGVGFDWNALATDKSSYFKGHDVGLIAQEVEPLIPSAIGTIWGEYKRLDYTKITPYLVEGWKEHDNEIDRLRKRVSELESEVNKLRKYVN